MVGKSGVPNDAVEKFRIGPLISEEEKENKDYFQTKEGRVHFFKNTWPENCSEFQDKLSSYYHEMETLSKKLLQLIEFTFKLPPGRLTSCVNYHTSILSANFYAVLESAVEEQFIRIAEHTDVSLFTIVAESSFTSSLALEFWNEDQRKWEKINFPPQSFVVNIGDCFQYWSDGLLNSAKHRVAQYPRPRDDKECAIFDDDNHRISLAFFFSPNYDTTLLWHDAENAIQKITPKSYSSWRRDKIRSAIRAVKSG